MLKAQACPLPEVRQFRPVHPVTNPNMLGTSRGSYQPISNLSSEPGGAAKEEQGDLPVPWCCLVASALTSTLSPSACFPQQHPPPTRGWGCTGLGPLPAGFHSSSHAECNERPYRLECLSQSPPEHSGQPTPPRSLKTLCLPTHLGLESLHRMSHPALILENCLQVCSL